MENVVLRNLFFEIYLAAKAPLGPHDIIFVYSRHSEAVVRIERG
ncbi:hypothetical protein [Anaerobacterium chartisolvens]|nr:hypothetical protein [Anaerobacterium chartisolvens]